MQNTPQDTIQQVTQYSRLRDTQYLDDIIINDTLKQLFRNRQTETYINTYFMPQLHQNQQNHGAVRLGKRKLQDTTIKEWYIPIHHAQHWLFLRVTKTTKTITQYDSMHSGSRHHGEILLAYLEQISGTKWSLQHGLMKQQQNGYDCGPYMLAEIQQQLQNFSTPRHWRPNRAAIYSFLTQSTHASFYQPEDRSISHRKGTHPQIREDSRHNPQKVNKNRTQTKLEDKTKIVKPIITTTRTPEQPLRKKHPKHNLSLPSPAQGQYKHSHHKKRVTNDQHNQHEHTTTKLEEDCHQGHTIRHKNKNEIRIYTQNIDGISTKHPTDHFHQMMQTMVDREVDIVGFSETNIEWTDPHINQQLYNIMKRHIPGGYWRPSTSKIPMGTLYKPGGNLLITNKTIRARTLHTDADDKGRWTWTVFYGSNKPITVIQLYVPCTKAGIYSAYAQQYQQLQQENPHETPNVIQRYYEDLQQLLEQQQHTHIILMGDFNQDPHNPHIAHIQAQHNLLDAFENIHPGRNFSTHNRGSKRIDYILVSRPLLKQIRKIGYEAYNAGIISDHRGMFLDIALVDEQKTLQRQHQKLISKQGNRTKKYRKLLMENIKKKRIVPRLKQLVNTKCWEHKNHQTLQQLDKDITKLMIEAEHQSVPTHTAPWSPKIKQLYQKLQKVTKQLKQHIHKHKQQLQEATKPLWEQHKQIRKELQEARKNAETHRQQYLHEQAEIYELLGQKNRAKIIQNIQKVEELRRNFGHIKWVLKTQHKQQLTQVTYPENNTWKVTNTPEELEAKIIEQQERHFHQSANTPIATITDKMMDVTTSLFQNFRNSQIPDTTTQIKQHFEREDPTEIPTLLTMEEFHKGIKKWRERTSTSPSGRHLGHYHAQILPDIPEENEKGYTQTFLWIHTQILNLAIHHGVILHRWKRVHTIASPKDNGPTKIHRIRSLNLYEADLNLILRIIISRRMLWRAEDKQLLADECWGTRKIRSAGDLGLQKVLTMELSGLTRQNIGQMDLDARACYDRINRPLAAQTCYKYGLPQAFCWWFLQLLNQQEHHIVLQTGVANKSYKHTPANSHHGIGQGSTAAPIIWLLISSTIFLAMQQWATGITWKDPTGTQVNFRIADVYVDDATLWLQHDNVKRLIILMTATLEKYHEILNWTGGALNLEKCFFTVMEWRFTKEGLPYLHETARDIKIQRPPHEKNRIKQIIQELNKATTNQALLVHELQQYTGIHQETLTPQQYAAACAPHQAAVPIKQLRSTEKQKSLGLFMTTSGDTTGAKEHFSKQNDTYGYRILHHRLQPNEVKRAHMAVHFPGQQYRFNGAPFSKQFLDQETNKTTTKILPKLGFAQTHPIALRHAPKNRGGLELPHFYTVQGITMIKQILRHLRAGTPLGQIMYIHLVWTQIQVGSQTGILTDTNWEIKYVQNIWWTKVRTFLNHIQGRLELEQRYTINSPQIDDISIMDAIQSNQTMTTHQLKLINAVRLYLQVTYISELTTSGKYIETNLLHNQNPKKWSRSKLLWPRQTKPGTAAWRQWRKAIQGLCKTDGYTLRQPLTNQWKPLDTHQRQWRFLHNRQQDEIYDTYNKYRYVNTTHTRRLNIYTKRGHYNEMDSTATPVQPHKQGEKLFLRIHPSIIIQDNMPPTGSKSQQNKESPTAPEILYAVSDGSVNNGRGTYGWVQATKNKVITSNNGHVEGPPGNITSFRAEAQGLADLVYNSTITDKTKIYLDNKAVIKKVTQETPLNPLQSEWELLEATRRQVCQRKLNIKFVKGHQNLQNPKTTWEAKLNHKADRLAAQAHQQPTHPGYLPPGYKVILYIQDEPITTKYSQEIIRASHTPEIREYYRKKYKWTDDIMETLDWEAYTNAQKRFNHAAQKNIHKYTHNWLPTGNNLQKRYNTQNKCPYCKLPENHLHVITCATHKEDNERFYQKFENMLKRNKTDLGLSKLMIQMLKGEEIEYDEKYKNKIWIQQLITEQKKIGTELMWTGHITQTWGDIQEHEYRQTEQKIGYTGSRWARIVLQHIFKHMLDRWSQRNKKLHNNLQQPTPYREAIQAKITELYTKYEKTPEVFPRLYKHKLKHLLQKPMRYLLRWYDIIQPMDRYAKVQKQKRPGTDIRKYLPMQDKPPE